MKNKKILTILTIIAILINNIGFIYAEDEQINEEEQIEYIQEEKEEIEIKVNDELTQSQLNNINNNLNNLNENFENLLNSPLLTTVNITYRPIAINFDIWSLYPNLLLRYYDYIKNNNYSDKIIEIYQGSGSEINNRELRIMNVDNYGYDNEIYYNYVTNGIRYINNNDNATSQTYNLNYSIGDNTNQNRKWLYYKNYITGEEYKLIPFKLNIINNLLGDITNSVNVEPYVSTNIYYDNQQITLTYDNSNNDFGGWYINNTMVSDNLSYTFNITTDTTIEIRAPIITEDDTNKTILIQIEYLMIILLGYLFMKGIISYE